MPVSPAGLRRRARLRPPGEGVPLSLSVYSSSLLLFSSLLVSLFAVSGERGRTNERTDSPHPPLLYRVWPLLDLIGSLLSLRHGTPQADRAYRRSEEQ